MVAWFGDEAGAGAIFAVAFVVWVLTGAGAGVSVGMGLDLALSSLFLFVWVLVGFGGLCLVLAGGLLQLFLCSCCLCCGFASGGRGHG